MNITAHIYTVLQHTILTVIYGNAVSKHAKGGHCPFPAGHIAETTCPGVEPDGNVEKHHALHRNMDIEDYDNNIMYCTDYTFVASRFA